jgi:hypothetical protein
VVKLFDQKNKREPEGPELSAEESDFKIEPAHVEIGSGYTLQVSRDENERPVIDVKTYGKIDMQKLRREIKRTFPNAQIRQFNQTTCVTVTKRSKKKPKPRKK